MTNYTNKGFIQRRKVMNRETLDAIAAIENDLKMGVHAETISQELLLRIAKMEAAFNTVEVNHCSESQCPNRREFGSIYCRYHALALFLREVEKLALQTLQRFRYEVAHFNGAVMREEKHIHVFGDEYIITFQIMRKS